MRLQTGNACSPDGPSGPGQERSARIDGRGQKAEWAKAGRLSAHLRSRPEVEQTPLRVQRDGVARQERVPEDSIDPGLERLDDRGDVGRFDLTDADGIEGDEPALGPAVHRHDLNYRRVVRDRDAKLL